MKICVPIQEKRQSQVKRRLKQLVGKADLAEIWLDHIEDLDLPALLKDKPLPILCVCKKPVEKGRFKGSNKEVAELLIECIKNGADYVDIPLFMPVNLNKKIVQSSQLKAHSSKLIISYHNFEKTPSESVLLKKVDEMKARGADIVKIATKANLIDDAFQMIMLADQLKSQKIPHILIAMGQKGLLTRIVTPKLGGTMMFAPLRKTKSSAPGQLTARQLRSAWKVFK